MLVAIVRLWVIVFTSLVRANEESDEIHYTNSWAVHVNDDDFNSVNQLANKHGFTNLGQIGSLPGYFHFVKKTIKEKSKRSLDDHTELLLAEPKVKWVKQQRILERSKRNIIPDQEDSEREKRDTAVTIQDPFYKDQWYLQNIGQSSGPAGLDINVLPVWGQGYTGKGIVVSILDDGVDHTHPDLKRNYDPDASFDFNDFDPDPKPRSTDPLNCHGTKCAGEVAAEANNGICGVGVSFNASIGGIRMLDGKATDTIEGSSLSYRSDYIDIYTCCWGPKDDGKRFGKPGFLASKALKIGAERGRGGKGSIFVWATGNGGMTDDDCNCDGYTTSIYTVSIGAISDHGLSTYYTETCASTLAVTFSGASHREAEENKIITTGLDHKCTKIFKGTSSAAPLASGMLALVLEANPNLTWRDVQHIIVETSQKTSPLDEGWKINGAGKEFNLKFGFGKLDAMRMIEKAKNWENVPKQRVCYSKEYDTLRNIPSSGSLIMSANSSACAGTTSEIRKLEHVQVKVSLEHRHRGQLSVTLISPSGTRSELLKTRRNDHSTAGLKDWVFMTVHCWGEDPKGTWTLIVTDNDRNTREHHVIKAKQGDSEDVTRVVMDDTEKQGPWDANEIKEYDSAEPASPENHPSQDHILKGMESTMGELVTGNKFTELAKRKKDRHHSAKGFVGKNSNKRYGHAQNKLDSRRTEKGKNWTKKKNIKLYKLKTSKFKNLGYKTGEKANLTARKNDDKKKTLKHSPKTHKHHKHLRHKIHKYTKKFKKKHYHNHRRHKDRPRGQGGRKRLMAEGSIEIPKDRSPLEAKIAVKALMNPYFKFSTSKIVLPKQYQGFMGEVDIKMKLVKDQDKERNEDENERRNRGNKQDSHRKTAFPKPQNKSVNMSQLEGVSEVVKQKNEIKNLTHDFGTHLFRIPSKEIKLLEEAKQNTELKNTSERTPQELQDNNREVNSSNVYANLLKSMQSMRNSDVTNSSTEVYERIDLLTDDKVYNHDNANNSIRIIGRNSTAGSDYTGSNLTGSVHPGSDLTGSDDTGHGLNEGNSSKRNVSGNDFKGKSKTISVFDALRNVGNENEAVSPDDVPIIFYDAEKNQFAEVRKINESEAMKVPEGTGNEAEVTGNEVNRTGNEVNETGSKIIENGSNGIQDDNVPDEASGVSGSSGVLIEERTDCDDGSSFEVKCVTEEMSNGLISQTAEQLDKAAGETTGDDDDGNDNNTDVTDYATGSHRPQGSQDSRKAARAEMDPSKDKDEGRLAFLLSTERYQDVPAGSSKQVGLTQVNESTPLNTSDLKDQMVPERTKMSQEKLQTGIKHQDIPARPFPKEEPSQSKEKSPLHRSDQEEENVPNRPSKKTTDPNNPGTQIDSSNMEPMAGFASKDFAALEHALERQVARLEKFKDESQTSSQFLERVKDDIRDRNVEDLKSLENEIRNDMKDVLNDRDDGRKEHVDTDMFLVEPKGDLDDDMNEDGDEDEEFHRLQRRRVSKSALKRDSVHNNHSKNNDKYYKGSSGILKSLSLILYGT